LTIAPGLRTKKGSSNTTSIQKERKKTHHQGDGKGLAPSTGKKEKRLSPLQHREGAGEEGRSPIFPSTLPEGKKRGRECRPGERKGKENHDCMLHTPRG